MNISFIPMALMQMLIWTHCLNYSYQIMVSINANCVTARPPPSLSHPPAQPHVRFDASKLHVLFQTFLQSIYLLLLIHLDLMGVRYIRCFFFNFVCLGKDLSIQYIIGESYTLSFSPRKDYNYWLKNLEFLTEIYIYRISAKTY